MPLPIREIKPIARANSDSLLFKAAAFLNRTNSAAMGMVSETLAGRDPVAAITQSLAGDAVYGGQDVMAQMFGGSPDDKLNRRVGLAMDILNPLDPLNYVGLGTLTKTGKLAKLAGGLGGKAPELAKGLAAQAKAGQRGLLTFGGMQVIPGASVLGGIERAGKAVAASGPGQGFKKLFGGRAGYIEASVAPELKAAGITPDDVRQFIGLSERADYVAHAFNSPATMALDDIKKSLRPSDYDAWNGMMDALEKGEDFVAESTKFIGAGKGMAKRRKAVEAAQRFMSHRAEWAKQLGDEGVGGMAEEALGYMPRVTKMAPGVTDRQMQAFYGRFDDKTGKVVVLDGPSNNAYNRALTLDSEQPIARNTLTAAGQREFDRLTGRGSLDPTGMDEEFAGITGGRAPLSEAGRADMSYFEKLKKENPKAYRDWIKKYRLPRAELDARIRAAGLGELEDRPWAMFKAMQDEIGQKLRVTTLLESLERAGLAKKWDDLAEEQKAMYVRVDRGKWTDSPLAVPAVYDNMLKRFQEVYMPGPDKPVWIEFLNNLLPRQLQNLGIIPWWKATTIYGGLGPAYWSRNLNSGVLKNWLEGMGPGPNSARHYGEAATMAGQSFKGTPEQFADSVDGYFTTKQGVQFSRRRFAQEYMRRKFHGGGGREGVESELFPGRGARDPSVSEKVRETVVGPFARINFRNELIVRGSLAMKVIEDTFDAAQKQGIPLPKSVEALEREPEVIGDLVDRAITNAREAVLRSHFDYDDLTPFERTLRAHYIPFYKWMRANIPHETMNMITQPGKYMPYARAYYNSFEQQGVTPEDLPEWAHRSFATPISPEEGDRARWLDWTGFVPFLDVAELVDAVAAPPQTGRTRAAEAVRYLAIRANPFISQVAEQGLQKSFFTGRSLDVDTPQDIMGVTVGAPLRHALGLVRPAVELDRLNPGGVFGKTPRPHRNEPEQGARILRALSGVKVRATDRDEASMSTRERARQIGQLYAQERRLLRDGDRDGAQYVKERRERLQKGLR